MTTFVTVDSNQGILITEEMRKEAGIASGQTLAISVQPGPITIEAAKSDTKLVKEGNLLVIDGGSNFDIPIEEAIRQVRGRVLAQPLD